MSAFRLIDAEKASYPVTALCRMLGVSKSGYYAWSMATTFVPIIASDPAEIT